MTDKKRLFTIQELATLAGVSTSALRAWERRHDLFRPDRTPAGHRLYTSDDLKVFWYVSHLRSEEWDLKTISGLGRDELLARANQYFSVADEPSLLTAGRKSYDVILGSLVEGDFDAALVGLEKLYTVTESNLEFADLCVELMAQVGDAWHSGRISIAAEHALTSRLRHLMLGLLYLRGSADFEASAPSVVCACMETEMHELGLLRVSVYLREWGFKVTYVGANTPLEALEEHVLRSNPALVCVSITAAMKATLISDGLARLALCIGSKFPTYVGGSGLMFALREDPRFANLHFIESMEQFETSVQRFFDAGQSAVHVRT